MIAAFLYAARLYPVLCLQSLSRRTPIGQLSLGGRLLRVTLYLLLLPVFLLNWLALLIDEVLFPAYRRVQIVKPVFILGVPRSGTTFLHRTLSEDKARFSSVSTWEVLFAPSIVQRKFWLTLATVDRWAGSPLARLFTALERRLFKGLEGVHDVSLEAAEEDYLLLLPLLSCFILFLPFTESRHIWKMARFDWEATARDKRIIMGFYRACLQKHLYVHGSGRTYLSKNAAFASWPRSLHEEFPDARFVVCMREPDKAVPSLLGSLQGGAEFFQLDLTKGELPELLTEMMSQYYRHLLTEFPVDAPIISMQQLKTDIVGTIESLYARLGEELTSAYRGRLASIRAEASRYRTRTQAIKPHARADAAFYRTTFPWYYREVPAAQPDKQNDAKERELSTRD